MNKKYIIITPVRDEEQYIEQTINSVVSQTILPVEWVIVDDGSSDKSAEIIDEYCRKYEWIRLLRISRDSKRQPGSAVINAFNRGYELVKEINYDFIVKLDCDLRFDPDYFEKLILKFHVCPELGVASGVYLEKKGKEWVPVKMPNYHAAGASKVMRKECFSQIGGFIPARGWDTIDEIKAQALGWKTTHFQDIEFYHLKNEGAGIGQLRTNLMHGEIFYLTGGSKLFFLVKVMHRMLFGSPPFVGGLMMVYGFLRPLFLRKELLVSRDEAIFYRKLLNRRIFGKFLIPVQTEGLGRNKGQN